MANKAKSLKNKNKIPHSFLGKNPVQVEDPLSHKLHDHKNDRVLAD